MTAETPARRSPFIQWLRFQLRSHRLALSALVLGVGVVMAGLALGDLTPLKSVYPFTVFNRYTDQNWRGDENWNLIFAIAGPIPLIVGGQLVGIYLFARRRFEQLMRSESITEFLRSTPVLEELLRDLTPDDQLRYERKCAELPIRGHRPSGK